MEDSRYTKEGLAIISEETCDSLFGILKMYLSGSPHKTIKCSLDKDNPRILEIIKHVRNNPELGEQYLKGVAMGVFITYELLRRQSDANKLEDELKQVNPL